MKFVILGSAILIGGLLTGQAASAQSATGDQQPTPQHAPKTQAQTARHQRTDGEGLPMVGPASNAYRQRTDGGDLPMVGPGSKAYKP